MKLLISCVLAIVIMIGFESWSAEPDLAFDPDIEFLDGTILAVAADTGMEGQKVWTIDVASGFVEGVARFKYPDARIRPGSSSRDVFLSGLDKSASPWTARYALWNLKNNEINDVGTSWGDKLGAGVFWDPYQATFALGLCAKGEMVVAFRMESAFFPPARNRLVLLDRLTGAVVAKRKLARTVSAGIRYAETRNSIFLAMNGVSNCDIVELDKTNLAKRASFRIKGATVSITTIPNRNSVVSILSLIEGSFLFYQISPSRDAVPSHSRLARIGEMECFNADSARWKGSSVVFFDSEIGRIWFARAPDQTEPKPVLLQVEGDSYTAFDISDDGIYIATHHVGEEYVQVWKIVDEKIVPFRKTYGD